MFFEAVDLYRALDLKFNSMDDSHLGNNFKQTINCRATRANTNEPSKDLQALSLLCDVRYSTMEKLSRDFSLIVT